MEYSIKETDVQSVIIKNSDLTKKDGFEFVVIGKYNKTFE